MYRFLDTLLGQAASGAPPWAVQWGAMAVMGSLAYFVWHRTWGQSNAVSAGLRADLREERKQHADEVERLNRRIAALEAELDQERRKRKEAP